MPPPILGCLPETLHPVSQMFLEAWLAGELSTTHFQRFFHLPNSDYLEVGRCIITLMGIGS